MNCNQCRARMESYLHGEVDSLERAALEAHLLRCPACQAELALQVEMQQKIRMVLQRQADPVVPSVTAWERLQARLPEVAQPPPVSSRRRLSCPAPYVSPLVLQFLGGTSMYRKLVVTVLAVVLMVGLISGLIYQKATPISAQGILEQAYAAQMVTSEARGIQHIRMEIYENFQLLPQDQAAIRIMERYLNFETGQFRTVSLDGKTNQPLDGMAYDGHYLYRPGGEGVRDPLVLYRTAQERAQVSDLALGFGIGDYQEQARAWFEGLRNAPEIRLLGTERWEDGRTVYRLQSQQSINMRLSDFGGGEAGGDDSATVIVISKITLYIDTQTYHPAGSAVTYEKDGQEFLVQSQREVVNEILPAGAAVVWNFSDLPAISIVDDPEGRQGNLLPEVISAGELAAHTPAGYLLAQIPEGFTLEISAPPQIEPDEVFVYIASYRSPANDCFVIQSDGNIPVDMMATATEIYTTTRGMVLHFIDRVDDPTGRKRSVAIAVTPDNYMFWINSTLSHDTVNAWAETLTPAQQR